ncbi:MAG TPA: hypothetical protein VK922_07530 [Gemmatimonadaceae bacterium]|nr:hypothetical protein [Gemmatimonadaceae bacterium]
MSIDDRKDNETSRKPEHVGHETVKDLAVAKTDAREEEQVKGGMINHRRYLE